MKIITQISLIACGLIALGQANGDAPALSSETLLATPAKVELRTYPEDLQINAYGEVQKSNDGTTGAIQMAVGLGKAYDIPWCVEYPADGQDMRVQLTPIPIGQPLKDALKAQPADALQWEVIRGRAIVSFVAPDKAASAVVLDREVRLDSDATTLGAALAALETAYNAKYNDIPLLIALECNNAEPESPLETAANQLLPGPLVLRDGILEILDAAGQFRATYGASLMRDPEGRSYVIVHVRRDGCRSEFASDAEYMALREQVTAQKERLTGYFSARPAK